MKCQECERVRIVLKEDPRTPPLDTEPCLCTDCYESAADDVVAELEDHIKELKVVRNDDRISRKELLDLVHDCPIGYNGKHLIRGSWTTEADIIEWFGKLQKLAGYGE